MIPKVEKDRKEAEEVSRKFEKRIKNREKVLSRLERKKDKIATDKEKHRSLGYDEIAHGIESREHTVDSRIDLENKKITKLEEDYSKHKKKAARHGLILRGRLL